MPRREGDALGGILALLHSSIYFGGFGARPGLSTTECLGAVPLGGTGTYELAPEILPVTWDLSHEPLVLAKGNSQGGGGLG